VNYWESRREVFGPDKFVLRMTLNEALRDDLAAVKACFFRPLPHLDASGRQLIFLEPSRHTREGYTSKSMVRKNCGVIYVFSMYTVVHLYVFICRDTSHTVEFLVL
jgi:hypothetical protein